jgi:hypothetical protein
VWREIPDSFDEFVTSPKHLRLGPLYPRQRAAVIELIGTDATRIFEDPYNLEPEQVARIFEDPYNLEPEQVARAYQQAVLLWGRAQERTTSARSLSATSCTCCSAYETRRCISGSPPGSRSTS